MELVASILCALFILWLLARDSKRRTSVSATLWVPILIVLVFSSRTPSGWLDARSVVRADYSGLTNDAPGNLLDQVFFAVMIAGSWIIASVRGVKWTKLLGANIALALFYLYFAISSLWSAYPADSLIRVVKDLGTTVFVVAAILSEEDPAEAVRAVYVRCACILFPLSILFIRYYPQFGRSYAKNGGIMFTGVATHKNAFGEMLMVFSLILIWDHLETRTATAKWPWSGMQIDRVLLLLMGVWLLSTSQSKTSLVCFLIGLTLLLSSKASTSPMIGKIVFFTALSLPFLILVTHQFSSSLGFILEAIGRDDTFTGRADIWKHITFKTVNPLIGAGYWNFWGGKGGRAISEVMQTPVPNAHDGYLDIYIDGGIIGLMILLFVLLAAGNRIIRKLQMNLLQRARFAFLIVAIVVNLTESNFARPSLLWFTTLLMIIVEIPVLRSRTTNRFTWFSLLVAGGKRIATQLR